MRDKKIIDVSIIKKLKKNACKLIHRQFWFKYLWDLYFYYSTTTPTLVATPAVTVTFNIVTGSAGNTGVTINE